MAIIIFNTLLYKIVFFKKKKKKKKKKNGTYTEIENISFKYFFLI